MKLRAEKGAQNCSNDIISFYKFYINKTKSCKICLSY